MKIIVMGFAGAQIVLMVVNSEVNQEPIERQQVWYSDFIPSIKRMYEQYHPDEILLFGAKSYNEGLAHQLQEIFSTDENLAITIVVENKYEQEQARILNGLNSREIRESGLIL